MSHAGYPASQSAGTFRRDTATKRRHDATSQHPLARNERFYNRQRIHTALGGYSPVEYELKQQSTWAEAA